MSPFTSVPYFQRIVFRLLWDSAAALTSLPDTSPLAILLHLPLVAEDKNVPCKFNIDNPCYFDAYRRIRYLRPFKGSSRKSVRSEPSGHRSKYHDKRSQRLDGPDSDPKDEH